MVLEGLAVKVVLVVLEVLEVLEGLVVRVVLVVIEVLEGTVVIDGLVLLELLELLEVSDDFHTRSWRGVSVLGAFTGKVGLKGVRGTKGCLEALDGGRVENVEGVATSELGTKGIVKGVGIVNIGGGVGANIEEGRALEGPEIELSSNVSGMSLAGFGEN